MVNEVTDFENEVISRSESIPVLVDFWAPWCDPCLMLEPIITSLAEENPEGWKLIKVNIDDNQALADRYNIRGVPAIRIFHKGEIIANFNGLMYKPQMREWIDSQMPTM